MLMQGIAIRLARRKRTDKHETILFRIRLRLVKIQDAMFPPYGSLLQIPKLIGSRFRVQRLQQAETAYYIDRDPKYLTSTIG